jgi:acyl-CoA thioester hydrolase
MMNSSYLEKKIYYHDTDCGGVVYYANYLKYLEEARTEYLLERGIELPKLADKHIYFVVARVEIDYKSPARYQEKLGVFTRIEDIKLSTVRFFQEVKRGETTVAKATTTLACIGKDFKTISVPEELKKKLGIL